MRLIVGNRFKTRGVEYVVTKVTWISISDNIRESYTFKTVSWDNPVMEYTMSAKDFESKVTIENYIGLT